MPSPCLHDHSSLASSLVQFLLLLTGRAFDDKSRADKDHWSAVVWDLLEVGISKVFNRRRPGRPDALRGSGHTLDEMDGYMFATASPPFSHSFVTDIVGHERACDLYRMLRETASDDGVQRAYEISGEGPPRRQRGHENDFDESPGIPIVLIETTDHGVE